MTIEPKPERMKLLVVTQLEPKPIGDKGAIKYSCKAKVGDHEFLVFTFSKPIGELFKAGQTLDADVLVTKRESEDPERPWIDRKVVQIYQDGQPIIGQKAGRPGWQPRMSNPDERASIEGQVAMKEVGEGLRMLESNVPIDVTDLYWNVVRAKLRALLGDAPVLKRPAGPPAPGDGAKDLKAPQDTPTAKTDGIAGMAGATEEVKFHNLGEFMEGALKKGYKTRKTIEDKLKQNLDLVGNLEEAYKKL